MKRTFLILLCWSLVNLTLSIHPSIVQAEQSSLNQPTPTNHSFTLINLLPTFTPTPAYLAAMGNPPTATPTNTPVPGGGGGGGGGGGSSQFSDCFVNCIISVSQGLPTPVTLCLNGTAFTLAVSNCFVLAVATGTFAPVTFAGCITTALAICLLSSSALVVPIALICAYECA